MTQTAGSHRLELDTDFLNNAYQAVCSCGWVSAPRMDETAAIEAGDEHVADQS